MSSPSLPSQNGSQPSPPVVADKTTHQPPPRVRRRNRLITSCLECRRRKLKCDKCHPCAHCTKNARQCVFIASGLDSNAQAKLAEVKEQMGRLERSLEEDVARKTEANTRSSSDFSRVSALPGQEQSSDKEDDEETQNLRPTHLVTEDATYYEPDDDVNLNEDIDDLGFRMGRIRITERIGGLVRPRFSDELTRALNELPDSEYPPQISTGEDPADWLAPTQDYVAPSSNFMLTSTINQTYLEAHLPSRMVVDELLAHYWNFVHIVARTVHRPSFERQYQNFWIRVNMGTEPRSSFQAVLFAALLSSVISMTEDEVRVKFGMEKRTMVDSFREGTEKALAKANFLRTTKLETLQAFVTYLIPLCRNEVSRSHSALTGSLIRLAECMGLHRDPTAYSSSPVEIQVRRLLWYQICFLDLRTCEAVGPRPQIRLEDYDTRFPLNIDDIDLDRAEHGDSSVDVSRDRKYFTDMTICRMRFEAYEMHRFLWSERPKLDRKRADGKREITITSILSRVQSFQSAMEKKYVPMLDRSELLHVLASELYGIVSNRLYISILQQYITSARSRMPERLRQLTMSAATMILEHGMAIELHPVLSSWSWIVGALHQHHCALLLVNEIYIANPEPAMEQRIWRCLDYSFKLPPGIPNVEKTRMVLEELIGKTRKYSNLKRVRVPSNMPQPCSEPRQRVQREDRERSGSTQSNLSTLGPLSHLLNGNMVTQNCTPPPRPQSPPAGSALAAGVNTFPGAIPLSDWGTFDMPASVPMSPYGGIAPTSCSLVPGAAQQGGSDADSPNSVIYRGDGMAGRPTFGNALDAINDIDWNDGEDKYLSKTAAQGRCNIAKDSGYTKADKTPGSYFCLFFARGICPKGVDCEYLHRLPTVTDIFPSNVDCFGRDKHADYRDDMGGVGTFQRQNRTLYIGRIHPTDDIEEIVSRHMQEWGEIERTRVLTARGVAFVTYTNEANSQFAKEAMAHQSFDHNEILNVRWATVDPNPQAAKREARRIEEQAAEAIRKALPAAYVAELEGRDPESKKRRKVEGSFGLQGYEAPDDVWYAKEKSDWEAAKQLESGGMGERMMIESAESTYQDGDNIVQEQESSTAQQGNGILSGSTLAALKGFKATPTNKRPAPVAGPLVDYGSDSD